MGVVDVSPCKENLQYAFVYTKKNDVMTDESVCLDVPDMNEVNAKVKVIACSGSERQKWQYDKNVSFGEFPFIGYSAGIK